MAPLTIGLSLSATWLRGEAWRRADSRVEELFAPGPLTDAARLAEEAGIDFLFKPDALVLDPATVGAGPGFSSLDPVVLMAVLAQATSRIGLVPTVSATYAHPYTVARQLQSIDQLSGGRVGWNLVTSLGGAENFAERARPADPYANAADFLTVVEDLRQSFPADALLLDRDSGRFADPERFSVAEPRGIHASSGPLTVPAVSPQPWPLLHAGGSPQSLAFAAEHADAVFAMTATADDASTLRRRLSDAAGRHGRRVRVLPGLSVCLGDTRADAHAAAASLGERPSHVQHWSVVGTPQDAVDEIAAWHRAEAIDGVIALPTGSWRSLELFCAEVVPALTAAGVFAGGSTASGLRARWEASER